MIIAYYYCCRGSAEEHQNNNGEKRDIYSYIPDVSQIAEFVSVHINAVWDKFRGRRSVDQCSYLDVDPNIKSHTIIFKQIVQRGTMTPYEFKFYDPVHIITGIACGPQDDKTSSPEVEVIEGGISCHSVVIRLSPVQKGPWACCIEISGIEGTA
jgi:hypothetical protein